VLFDGLDEVGSDGRGHVAAVPGSPLTLPVKPSGWMARPETLSGRCAAGLWSCSVSWTVSELAEMCGAGSQMMDAQVGVAAYSTATRRDPHRYPARTANTRAVVR
jgi:hypothetical protein